MNLRLLSAADVRRALPMAEAIQAMHGAFGQLSAGEAAMPLRGSLSTALGTTLLMPAFLRRSEELAVKVVSVYPENPSRGLPMIAALVLVLDPATGRPRAVMDGASLTALRTGAAGGLAADLLARPDAETVALFGAGVQARTQLEAVRAVRNVRRVFLIDRSRAAAERLAAEIADAPDAPIVVLADSPREAVASADIVVTATTSHTPVFDGRDLRPGTHVTGVGSFTLDMQEVDPATVLRARVFVDQREACLEEAGDLVRAESEPATWTELGEVVNGTRPGRASNEEITFFKSVGVAVQDAAAAAAVLKAAEARGLGERFNF